MQESDKNKVLVGLSGGVDSSVSAWLLREAGYEVYGACLRLCQPESEIEDAAAVAAKMGIPFSVVDLSARFREHIIGDFGRQYACGRTPNPCALCNPLIKWTGLLSEADRLGIYYIASGHYAEIREGRIYKNPTSKDQSYALYGLKPDQLQRTLLPLGSYDKAAVRDIAAREGLPAASKSDSQDICFVPEGDYADVLRREGFPTGQAGTFVRRDGKVLGTHKGIEHYTVGQRRGLGIAADRSLYVLEIRPESREVVLGYEEETLGRSFVCGPVNWQGEIPQKPIAVTVKIRYNHRGVSGRVTACADGMAAVTLDTPVKAITPGQSAVFYDGGLLLGGGIIQ